MQLWLSPGEYVFWKNTRSPALSSSREGCEPLLYSPNMPRLSGLPTCLATYHTKPEQSKPLGLEPPHTYGAPSSFKPAPARPSLGAPRGGATTATGAAGLGVGVACAPAGVAAVAGFDAEATGAAVGVGVGGAGAAAAWRVAGGAGTSTIWPTRISSGSSSSLKSISEPRSTFSWAAMSRSVSPALTTCSWPGRGTLSTAPIEIRFGSSSPLACTITSGRTSN